MIVLYAEDDIEDFSTFYEVLISFNPSIKCLNARNGLEVLEILENAITLPEYVFLDINMPSMDGKACLKRIKTDQRFKSIPVIIYTTSKNPMDIELCRQLGASDYLVKPSSVKEAYNSLAKFFKSA